MLMPTEGTMTGLEQPSLEEPQVENPELVLISELVPDYSDVPLVGFSQPKLHQVILWIRFEAQSMCEPLWRMELAQIQQDEEIHYLAAMFTWFHHWQILRGSWPRLPHGKLNLSQEMKEEIDQRFDCVLGYSMLSIGDMQVLKMLTALQCLTEVGNRRPAPG